MAKKKTKKVNSPIIGINFAQMNEIPRNLVGALYDPDISDTYTLGKVIKDYYSIDLFDGKGDMVGFVLRDEGDGSYKVRIPEYHSMLPLPRSFGKDATDPDNHVINMHSTCINIDDDTDSVLPGYIVLVTFQDLNSMSGGQITAVLQDGKDLLETLKKKIQDFYENNALDPSKIGSRIKKPILSHSRRPPANVRNYKVYKPRRYRQNRESNASITYQNKDCFMYKKRQSSKEKISWRKGGTIGSAGCGLISFKMVLDAFGLDKYTTQQLADAFVDAGWRKCAGGTNGFGFIKMAPKYGLKCRQLSSLAQVKGISSKVDKKTGKLGLPIIALAKGPGKKPDGTASYGYFTQGGHYIVIFGYVDGKYQVYNPWAGGREGWIPEEYMTDTINWWVFEK